MICYYRKYHIENIILWVSPIVKSRNGVEPCCLPFGKAGELQILCCQGIKVTDYNFTLDAWALKPSGFCSVRLQSEPGTGYFINQD